MQSNSPNYSPLQIFPENATLKLEFDVIKTAVLNNCLSEIGKNLTNLTGFSTDQKEIEQKLLEVKDFQDIILNNKTFPEEHYHNLQELLKLIELPDYSILSYDALKIYQFLDLTEKIIVFFKTNKESYNNLYLLVHNVDIKYGLKNKISTIIDPDGNIKNAASLKLASIRESISAIEHEIDRSFEKILHYCRSKEWLTEEIESVRNGERVLAVISKYKRKIKGIICDESITGKTTFIQPQSILDLRNKWFDLKQKEKREIYIILRELTKYIRPYKQDFHIYQALAAYVDHTRAKAKYSIYINASIPLISINPVINIKSGFHPVLFTKNRLSGKKIIPADIQIDEEHRILVISGPNAGGKSVCLKTVGLIQLMVQYGLPVPCDENSIIGIFHKLFVDIGDDQSIENDLSTYSSRLMNQHYFLKNADTETLFLIDEFGTGTDPAMGGVIAEVILEQLNNSKAKGVVTTHYTNLKVFAGKTDGVTNAAMLFDSKKMIPKYSLKIGVPGGSFALEILENIGFDSKLILETRNKILNDELDLNKLVIDLQDEKENSINLIKDIHNKEIQLNKLIEDNAKINQDIKSNKNQIISKSRGEAEEFLKQLNREFEKLVKDWKESKDNIKDQLAKELKVKVKTAKEKIIEELNKIKNTEAELNKSELFENDEVIFTDTGQTGKIVRIKKEREIVLIGNLKTELELSKLRKSDKKNIRSGQRSFNTALSLIKQELFNPVLDIRGCRKEEAINKVEIYLDKAILHEFNELKIIHGHGDGILKNAIRTMLKKYSFIKNFHSEHPDFGGDGVTIIEL